MQVGILWHPGASFGSRTPPVFGYQIRKLSPTNQQRSLWLYTKHLMDMLPRFWITWSWTFGRYSIFHSWQGGFLLIALLLGMLYCLFFRGLTIDSLTCGPNILFSDVYLNLLFNFKAVPSLDLSCPMSLMFIIAH